MKQYVTIPKEKIFMAEKDVQKATPNSDAEIALINIYDDVHYQSLLGFGGALTESAAYNYSRLSPEQKKKFLNDYFDKDTGLNYNICRLHINSCDFSLNKYDYVEDGDDTLETFSIEHDKKYIIPFVKDVENFTKNDIFYFASPWSPPAYMKENENMFGGGKLKEKYKKLWALYYCKYIKAYREEGINIKAITVQNEPKALQTWESCFYSAEDEKEFFEQYLIPTLDENGLSDIKVMIWDHNKERIYDRTKTILKDNKYADRIFAVACHWYSGDHFEALDLVHEHLKKDIILSEFCYGMDLTPEEVAEKYAKEICEDLNHHTAAICDWNVLLNQNGGPYHNRTAESAAVSGLVFEEKNGGVYAPVLFDDSKNELVFTPIYYYIAHFAKFIKPGAKRIGVTKYTDKLNVCAFQNTDGEIVAVIINSSDNSLPVGVRYNEAVTDLTVESHSITTLII